MVNLSGDAASPESCVVWEDQILGGKDGEEEKWTKYKSQMILIIVVEYINEECIKFVFLLISI